MIHVSFFSLLIPIKPLDLRFNNTLIERFSPNIEYVIALQDAMNKKFSETKFKLTEIYNKYRAYYDCKAEAKPLAVFSYCLLLNPKLMTQSDFASKSLPIWLLLYRIEKILTNSNYIIRKVGTNYTQCVDRICLRPVTPQGRIDDLTVINFKNFQRGPSLGHYRGEPTLFDESIPSLLEPPTTVVATQNVTEDPPPVTVSLRFSIAPAPVPVGLAAVPAPIPLPAVAAAPALVTPDTADVEAPEPQVLERPYLPTQDVRLSDSSDDFSTNDAPLHARTLRDTPTHMNSGEQRLPAEAIPTDRQSPLRPLSRSQSSRAISGAVFNTSLNDFPRNKANAFEFEQGPLLAPQPTEVMPTVDQGTLRVSPTLFSQIDDSDSSVDSTRENSIYIRNFRTTVQSDSQQAQSSSTDLPKSYDLRPRLPPRDYHEKVIQNKIPPKIRYVPITEPAATPNQLAQSQKRDAILDSCQRTRTLQSKSVTQKDPNVHDKYTHFRHSAQSTPPRYSQRQKEVKKRYSLTSLQRRLSNKNDVNAVVESSLHPKFCFSQSNILTATTCIAHCVSSDFPMGKCLASTIAWCYPELQQLRKLPINHFPPGSLVTYFNQQHQRFFLQFRDKKMIFPQTYIWNTRTEPPSVKATLAAP